jgi:hypothetical protein
LLQHELVVAVAVVILRQRPRQQQSLGEVVGPNRLVWKRCC